MEKNNIAVGMGVVFVWAFLIIISTAILVWVWPVVNVVFPGLVAGGYIIGEIGFWTAFKLSILTTTLFKSVQTQKKSS